MNEKVLDSFFYKEDFKFKKRFDDVRVENGNRVFLNRNRREEMVL